MAYSLDPSEKLSGRAAGLIRQQRATFAGYGAPVGYTVPTEVMAMNRGSRVIQFEQGYYSGPGSQGNRHVVVTYPILSIAALKAKRPPPPDYPIANPTGAETLDAYLPAPKAGRYGGLATNQWAWLKWREYMVWGTGLDGPGTPPPYNGGAGPAATAPTSGVTSDGFQWKVGTSSAESDPVRLMSPKERAILNYDSSRASSSILEKAIFAPGALAAAVEAKAVKALGGNKTVLGQALNTLVQTADMGGQISAIGFKEGSGEALKKAPAAIVARPYQAANQLAANVIRTVDKNSKIASDIENSGTRAQNFATAHPIQTTAVGLAAVAGGFAIAAAAPAGGFFAASGATGGATVGGGTAAAVATPTVVTGGGAVAGGAATTAAIAVPTTTAAVGGGAAAGGLGLSAGTIGTIATTALGVGGTVLKGVLGKKPTPTVAGAAPAVSPQPLPYGAQPGGSDLTAQLSQPVAGVPLWVWLAGGAALVLL